MACRREDVEDEEENRLTGFDDVHDGWRSSSVSSLVCLIDKNNNNNEAGAGLDLLIMGNVLE
jgi:hypothetical protein